MRLSEAVKGKSGALDAALEKIKRYIEEDRVTIDDLYGMGDITGGMLESLFDKFDEAEVNQLYDMKIKDWQNAFKQKYKMSDEQYVEKLKSDSVKKISPEDKKWMNLIADKASSSIQYVLKAISNGNYVYAMTPAKVVVAPPRSSFVPASVFTKKDKIDLKKLVKWLESKGIRKTTLAKLR